MRKETQEQLANEIESYWRAGSTALVEETYRNPVADYTDPTRLRAEMQLLFRTCPLVVGHCAELPLPRDFVARDVAGVPILVVRQDDGTIITFLNVCRHRGSKVTVEDCGHRGVFTCPYHAWSYRLDGSLLNVSNPDDFGEVIREDHGLVRLATEERHGLIWAVLVPGSTIDVGKFLGDELDDELASYGLDGFAVERSHTTSVQTNWKVIVDGFLETYHLGFLHSTTIGPHVKSNLAPFRSFGPHGCMTAVRNSFERTLTNTSGDPGPHLINAYQIFPNTVLVWSGIHMEAWMSFPQRDQPGASDVTVKVLGRADHVSAETDYWEKNWQVVTNTVLTEDFVVGAGIQQGFSSGAQTHLTFGRNEPGVQHFHKSIHQALQGAIGKH
jgi:phenylpropionate dioxygenase-like ring-hydroxylating dioxygenase large terminal subunit